MKEPRMTSSTSDPTLFATYCQEQLPTLLRELGVDQPLASSIGEDVRMRGEAFAALDAKTQAVLTAPFLEEVADYEPADATLRLKATVMVVVRNSRLEGAHAAGGPVGAADIKFITTGAAAPLSHLLASRRHDSGSIQQAENPFGGLAKTYPRAWAQCRVA